MVPSGWPLLYWVDHTTGDATYLGLFYRSGASGPDGFSGGYCDGGSTMVGTTPTKPENYYCGATDNETPAKPDYCLLYPDDFKPAGRSIGILYEPHAGHER